MTRAALQSSLFRYIISPVHEPTRVIKFNDRSHSSIFQPERERTIESSGARGKAAGSLGYLVKLRTAYKFEPLSRCAHLLLGTLVRLPVCYNLCGTKLIERESRAVQSRRVGRQRGN